MSTKIAVDGIQGRASCWPGPGRTRRSRRRASTAVWLRHIDHHQRGDRHDRRHLKNDGEGKERISTSRHCSNSTASPTPPMTGQQQPEKVIVSVTTSERQTDPSANSVCNTSPGRGRNTAECVQTQIAPARSQASTTSASSHDRQNQRATTRPPGSIGDAHAPTRIGVA